MVTAIVARSLPRLSVVIAKDLTSGSCELVTGSKSIGPTSAFGGWATPLSHNVASDSERFQGLELLMANEKGPNIKKKQKCKNCEGKGLLKKGDKVVKCQRCKGTGLR